jgi:hypothetical protein
MANAYITELRFVFVADSIEDARLAATELI